MVDRKDPLPIKRQCQLLDVSRSTFYYQRQGDSDEELRLMRRIDECHLKHTYYGSRRIRAINRDLTLNPFNGIRLLAWIGQVPARYRDRVGDQSQTVAC